MLSASDISSVVTLSDEDDSDKEDEEEGNDEDGDNESEDGDVDSGTFFSKDAANFLSARASEEIGTKSSEGGSGRYSMPSVLFQIGSVLNERLLTFFVCSFSSASLETPLPPSLKLILLKTLSFS